MLRRPAQLAYLVDDAVAAAERWAATWGAGPFLVLRHIPLASVSTTGGAPATFDHSSAYGQWGDVMVELVQVHEATPPSLAEAVSARTGLHHVAFLVEDLDAELARLAADLGAPTVLDAATDGGQRFAFADARATLGHLVELYEPSERLTGFYAHVASLARGWDGAEPVRVLR